MGTLLRSIALRADECERLEQLPNIGESMAQNLRRIGIHHPEELKGKDPFVLYQRLCALTGHRHDPCVLDTFMAATDFMAGAQPAPWWHYTAQRKVLFGPSDHLRSFRPVRRRGGGGGTAVLPSIRPCDGIRPLPHATHPGHQAWVQRVAT